MYNLIYNIANKIYLLFALLFCFCVYGCPKIRDIYKYDVFDIYTYMRIIFIHSYFTGISTIVSLNQC